MSADEQYSVVINYLDKNHPALRPASIKPPSQGLNPAAQLLLASMLGRGGLQMLKRVRSPNVLKIDFHEAHSRRTVFRVPGESMRERLDSFSMNKKIVQHEGTIKQQNDVIKRLKEETVKKQEPVARVKYLKTPQERHGTTQVMDLEKVKKFQEEPIKKSAEESAVKVNAESVIKPSEFKPDPKSVDKANEIFSKYKENKKSIVKESELSNDIRSEDNKLLINKLEDNDIMKRLVNEGRKENKQ